MLFEENWPKPRFRPLVGDVDWDQVAVMSYTGPEVPMVRLDAFRQWAGLQEKFQKYGTPSIGWFALWGSILPRLGLPIRSWVRHERSHVINPAMSSSLQVCSQIVDQGFLKVLHMDILPQIAEGEACPGDLTTAISFAHTFGRLGA
jgi:hypothetical protein